MKVGAGWRAVLLGAAVLLPGMAAADTIAGSVSQVGAWRVSGYTRGKTAIFDHCSLSRVQSEGFALAVGYTPQGVWTMGAEAPGWSLVANESYTGTARSVRRPTPSLVGRSTRAPWPSTSPLRSSVS
jgi:hypothetical protein